MLEDVGIVILNYQVHEETKEMLDSLKYYYPEIRTVIVDNGSPTTVVEKLHEYSSLYKNVSVLPLHKNLGYAKGNNAGIRLLREEGYSYICCSNSDVIIPEKGVLECLKTHLMNTTTAIAGPRIIGINGEDQNPLRITRYNNNEAKLKMQGYNFYNTVLKKHYKIIKKKANKFAGDLGNLLPKLQKQRLKSYLFKRKKTINNSVSYPDNRNSQFVYAVHGCFFMMGETFFKYYDGFDEYTFLYKEEWILAEMLFAHNLKSVYIPTFYIIHKEHKTTDYVWNRKDSNMQDRYGKQSTKYWYYNYYLKNNKFLNPK